MNDYSNGKIYKCPLCQGVSYAYPGQPPAQRRHPPERTSRSILEHRPRPMVMRTGGFRPSIALAQEAHAQTADHASGRDHHAVVR